MEQLLSPKQVARAIGVSESSLKRWCDQDLIRTTRTAGGHRRLTLSAVTDFLRESEHELVRPEILGLPATSGQSARVIERGRANMLEALLAGDEQQCHQLLVDLYLAKHSIATIGDSVIAPAFEQIGKQWECGNTEVYQERRACEITMRSVLALAKSLPRHAPQAPCAIGAAAWDDHYQLPTLLVEMVFRAHGWRAASLGCRLPAETLAVASRATKPKLFWLSVSHIENHNEFVAKYQQFQGALSPDTTLVTGGRALTAEIRERIGCEFYCEKLADLEQYLTKAASVSSSTSPQE